MTTEPWGVVDGYADLRGTWHWTSAETRSAILSAMGVDPAAGGAPDVAPVWVVPPGRSMPVPGPGELVLEDGTTLQVERALPADLPMGYHALRLRDGSAVVRLIAPPGQCFLPDELCTWGWAVQLYAVRSSESWGIGDLGDLRRLARWSATELGAGVLLVNPLHAATPVSPQQPSPYSPSSRRYRSPLYLRVEEVSASAEANLELERLAAAGQALNTERRIDRDAVWRLKMDALQRLWSRFGGHPGFDRYRREQGEALAEFATFCALAEHHGAGWRAWPVEHRRPDSAAVRRFATARADRVRFHQWLQWLLDEQMARAAGEVRLIQDLPVGVDPDGADAWAWQDLLATTVTVGAPPDEHNTQGQDWGLPPFVPHKLRAAAYGPVVETIRATLRHAGGIRIDHVMGLFRLFWIPSGAGPRGGGYVRYPAEELLAIVALESQRAGAIVVGEDLGTVEEGVRERLAARRILSYRLLWFEADPPGRYPRGSLAAVTTHDLPTIAGLWTGADLRTQHELGLEPNDEAVQAIRARLCAMAGLPEGAETGEVILRTHRLLAEAPSVVLTATLEDALAVEERPNLPGTTAAERPNWAIALPRPLEALETEPLARAIGKTLDRRRARDG